MSLHHSSMSTNTVFFECGANESEKNKCFLRDQATFLIKFNNSWRPKGLIHMPCRWTSCRPVFDNASLCVACA
eukprot:12908802-Prorocentrum_lima.AAC.1